MLLSVVAVVSGATLVVGGVTVDGGDVVGSAAILRTISVRIITSSWHCGFIGCQADPASDEHSH